MLAVDVVVSHAPAGPGSSPSAYLEAPHSIDHIVNTSLWGCLTEDGRKTCGRGRMAGDFQMVGVRGAEWP